MIKKKKRREYQKCDKQVFEKFDQFEFSDDDRNHVIIISDSIWSISQILHVTSTSLCVFLLITLYNYVRTNV